MIPLLHLCVVNLIIISNVNTASKLLKSVEYLAEKYPYVVALLDARNNHICTGCIIKKDTIITSGSCVVLGPSFVAVGVAVLNTSRKQKNLFEISSTAIHNDYIFETRGTTLNITKMHSNIGLVFTVRPVLNVFIVPADIGNTYAPELKEKNLVAFGFGNIKANVFVLQKQSYEQTPCENPKWYYCVCGLEKTYRRIFGEEFGNGGPVLFGNEVVAITASPCRTLILKSSKVKYNIFTVIGPYMPWIEKTIRDANLSLRFRSNTAVKYTFKILSYWPSILLISFRMLIR